MPKTATPSASATVELAQHPQAAMATQLGEPHTDLSSDGCSTPVKCIRGLPLSTWAFVFAQAVAATEEPGEARPITARVVRGMHYDELMGRFIDEEVADLDQQKAYFNEYRGLYCASLAKLPKADSDPLTEALSFFEPTNRDASDG